MNNSNPFSNNLDKDLIVTSNTVNKSKNKRSLIIRVIAILFMFSGVIEILISIYLILLYYQGLNGGSAFGSMNLNIFGSIGLVLFFVGLLSILIALFI